MGFGELDKNFLNFLSKIQEKIADNHLLESLDFRNVNFVCGVDVSYNHDRAMGVSVLWNYSTKKIIQISKFSSDCLFPYISNYLFLREGPIVMGAVESLSIKPDLVLVDGHGIAHPRRAGLAVFVGLVLDMPTIGVAKSLLVGKINPFNKKMAFIKLNGSIVGMAFKNSKKIYYLSPGHKLTLENLKYFLNSDYIYSLMTLKEAHRLSKLYLKEN